MFGYIYFSSALLSARVANVDRSSEMRLLLQRYRFDFPSLPAFAAPLVREFHVSKEARGRYQFAEALFSFHGNAVIADFAAAQDVATVMNRVREVERFPELTVRAGDLYSMGLLDEIFHLIIALYRQDNPDFYERAQAFISQQVGDDAFETTLQRFAETFPPTRVYKGEETLADYLAGETDGVPHKHVVMEELLLLYMNNENPALERFLDLFDDSELETGTAYRAVIDGLETFFDDEPAFGPQGESLFTLLRLPAMTSPTSLEGQLDFIRERWPSFLGEHFTRFMDRLLRAVDVLREEQKGMGLPGGFVPGPAPVLTQDNLRGEWMQRGYEPVEYERYSSDSSWMPNVIMLAKSTYVWLDQLSKRFKRDIHQLDHIPDEVLDELAERGFTALWLIGLWERSVASKTIKNMMGNPDAVASAYSLYDYAIAADLGGETAYENLRDRAWQRGIRLASDMVPNHMAIDSRWVAEHPDWFLSLPESPYPSYTFNGQNLSNDDRMVVQLEDHYFDKTDAAVVFRRIDNQTGEHRYIYHGNDGTSMPWNDTAQLNYLDPNVREGVIQTILHVARKFPVIRFDAAMTLAKQHIQRLWFPQPGAGGAIPSRAQRGMTTDEFDQHIPEEFWREVVNRVAEEVPDTLLLAEAFWMMEGYFVRTLGMHRVYNSAFMNMLKREANADYRTTIKNVLEFDPQILKRFVNFMNNPDEETAEAQFGKDDKYFGVCMMMVTMPGLPMIGHGQVEGFTEKYGMEYRRPRFDETPDQWLVDRHYREIFPLMHRRWQFSEVDNFLLYDFYHNGHVNEDVYVYSNHAGGKASLVVYQNKFGKAQGWIKTSSAFAVKEDGNTRLERRDLASGLGLEAGEKHFTILRDHVSGLDYLRRSRDLAEQGFYVELDAFKYHVFADIEEVFDSDGLYAQLHDELAGRPIKDAKESAYDVLYRPLHEKLVPLLEPSMVALAYPAASEVSTTADSDIVVDYFDAFLQAAEPFGAKFNRTKLVQELEQQLTALRRLAAISDIVKDANPALAKDLKNRLTLTDQDAALVVAWLATHQLGALQAPTASSDDHLETFTRWRIERGLARALQAHNDPAAASSLVALLVRYQGWAQDTDITRDDLLTYIAEDESWQTLIGVNHHDGVTWFNKEAFERLSNLLLVTAVLQANLQDDQADTLIVHAYQVILQLDGVKQRSQYRFDALIASVRPTELSADTDKTASASTDTTVRASATGTPATGETASPAASDAIKNEVSRDVSGDVSTGVTAADAPPATTSRSSDDNSTDSRAEKDN